MSARRGLRIDCATAVALMALVMLSPLVISALPRAVWNTTASIPTGLYAIERKDRLKVGERVALLPPPPLQRLLAERGYLPASAVLLKRIAAVGGQRVCRFAHGVTIDGDYVGAARARDRLGRALPSWSGCRTLQPDELFVMSPAAPDSFDGRYFGVLRFADVIGRATPVWTDEAGDGRHVWFADPHEPEPSTASKGAPVMQIGTFTATAAGFSGRLSTLNVDTKLTLVPAEPSDSENAPDYRVIAGHGSGAREVGAGWKRTGEKAGDYVAVQIDDPSLVAPLRANLFHGDGDEHNLVWSRPVRRETAN